MGYAPHLLDSRLRGNDAMGEMNEDSRPGPHFWKARCAGMTHRPRTGGKRRSSAVGTTCQTGNAAYQT